MVTYSAEAGGKDRHWDVLALSLIFGPAESD
jgi:hypothetical protein